MGNNITTQVTPFSCVQPMSSFNCVQPMSSFNCVQPMPSFDCVQPIPSFDYVQQVSNMITNDTNLLNLRYNNMLTSEYTFFTANPAFFIDNAYDIFATNNNTDFKTINNKYNILTYNDFHTSNMGTFSNSDSDSDSNSDSKSNNIIWSLNDFDGLSYNDINIDFARIGSSFAILNDNKTTNTDYFNEVYDTFITEYKSELSNLYEAKSTKSTKSDKLNKSTKSTKSDKSTKSAKSDKSTKSAKSDKSAKSTKSKNKITTLDIKLHDDKNKDIDFLKIVKDKIKSDDDFYKKYIENDKDNKFITSEEIINIDENLYETIAKKLAKKYHNIKIHDIVQKLYSGGSSFGGLRYYVYAKYAKYSDNNILLEIKQIIPIYDSKDKLIIPKAKTIYKYTKSVNGYSWSKLYNYLTINKLDYLIRLRTPGSSEKLDEKDFNKFSNKNFTQYMNISANLLAKFHYNSLLYEKINISKYIEFLKDKTEIIINNMKAFSISYVDINKKYFLYYKEKFSSV